MNDIWLDAAATRLFLFTPVVLLICATLHRLSAAWREVLITLAMIAVVGLQCMLIVMSHSPQVGYVFVEVPLTMLFGGMMLVLTFLNTVIFTLATAALICVTISMQPAFSGDVSHAMLFQTVTACVFVAYGNRQIEFLHRSSFLKTLRETLRSERLETVRSDLTTLSTLDPLTGVANRRFLEEVLIGHERAGRSIGLVMIDIDYFKLFNDAYGHIAGDACIKAVADALVVTSRPNDLVARFGGEEFVMVLDDCDEDTLASMIEQLRAQIRRLFIRHETRPDGKGHVTVSAGGACLTLKGGASRILIERADSALYEAKREGRDGARIAPHVVALAA